MSIGIKGRLDALDPAADKPVLDTVAGAMGVAVSGDFTVEKDAIVSALGAHPCTLADARTLLASLATATQGRVQ